MLRNHDAMPERDIVPIGQVLDPICGMTVDPATAAGSATHAGRTYHFCSRHCLERFQADPQRYTDETKAAPATPVRSAAVTYTCPMHPEVRQDHPGACPKCGMALEPDLGMSSTRVEYSCPMHPQVVSDHPGNC